MPERKWFPEKHGVVFALWDGKTIQLEERLAPGNFQGFNIIPGGGVESWETLEEALSREVGEEYGVKVLSSKKLGTVPTTESDGTLDIRHVFLITSWEGELSNPEGKNKHIEASLGEAFGQCKHPLSQIFLQMIEREVLSGQDS